MNRLVIFGTLVGAALVALLVKEVSSGLGAALLAPVRWSVRKIWRLIAPHNPLSLSIRTYRRHLLRSHLVQIENAFGGPVRQIPIMRGFTRLRLLTEERSTVDDFPGFVSGHPRVLVLGGAGTGKTTLGKHLIGSFLRGGSPGFLGARIPVFVRLRDLAGEHQSVPSAIIAAFERHFFLRPDNFVSASLDAGNLVIVLDGLDEAGESRPFVAEQIRRFCELDDQRRRKNLLVVTCRESGYQARDLDDVMSSPLRIEPFTNDDVRRFLAGWPARHGRQALELYRELQQAPDVLRVCRNPLLLGIMAGLYLDRANDFSIPRDRSRFYKATLDELLRQRPTRRGVAQRFAAEDKQLLLERLALSKLLSRGEHRDVIDHEELTAAAQPFMGPLDGRRLIRELIDVNGILGAVDGNHLTFAHRTFQEYMAACEAARTLSSQEALTELADREPETLLFYCAALQDGKQQAQILEHFVLDRQWERAGECLLHMSGAQNPALVDRIIEGLVGRVATPDAARKQVRAVEILSALAQREGVLSGPATVRFDRLVRSLLNARSTHTLEAALAPVPEVGRKMIPALLTHPDPEWNSAGVRLLKSQSTEESLDQLIALLGRPPGHVRSEACRALATLIGTRSAELRERVQLFPARTSGGRDRTVWPADALFPARITLPIIEGLVVLGDDDAGGNAALAIAVRVLKEWEVTSSEAAARRNLWRRVMLSKQVAEARTWTARQLVRTSSALYCTLALAVLVGLLLGLWHQKAIKFLPTGGLSIVDRVSTVNLDESVHRLANQSKRLLETVNRRYPVIGRERFLPWNWTTFRPNDARKWLQEMAELTPHNALAGESRAAEDRRPDEHRDEFLRLGLTDDDLQTLAALHATMAADVRRLRAQYTFPPVMTTDMGLAIYGSWIFIVVAVGAALIGASLKIGWRDRMSLLPLVVAAPLFFGLTLVSSDQASRFLLASLLLTAPVWIALGLESRLLRNPLVTVLAELPP